MRELAVTARLQGRDDDEFIAAMQDTGMFPSATSIDRWTAQYFEYGHVRAFCHTGNHCASREIRGHNLQMLSIYSVILPKSTHSEINAFLRNMNQGYPEYEHRFFHHLRYGEPRLG